MAMILFKKRLNNAIVPVKATPGSAGFDLHAATIEIDIKNRQLVIDTGLVVSFSEAYVMLIFGRSGLAAKEGLRLSNCVGVVDSDYRGPLKVILHYGDRPHTEVLRLVNEGDRIAQAVLVGHPTVTWEECEGQLPPSTRGEGGFGSTGT